LSGAASNPGPSDRAVAGMPGTGLGQLPGTRQARQSGRLLLVDKSAKATCCLDVDVHQPAATDGTVTNHLVNWLSPLKERVTIITGERGTFVADTLTADIVTLEQGMTTVAVAEAVIESARTGQTIAIPTA